MSAYLPDWLLKTVLRRPSNDDATDVFAALLVHPLSQSELDRVTNNRIKYILLQERWHRAIAPYIVIFKLAGEFIRGRYWPTSKKIRGSADSASGASAGTAGISVAQFTGPAGLTAGFAGNPAASASPSGLATGPVFEDAGIKAGEVVAYRAWRLRDGILHSCYRSYFEWRPGEIVEGDPNNESEGVHAFKSLLNACRYGVGYDENAGNEKIVTGTVELWGDVYEHERGYRASKAAIKWIDDSPEYDAKALRKLYGLTCSRKKK